MATIKSSLNGSIVTVAVEGFEPLVIDTAKLDESVRVHALADRVRAKLVDAGAKSCDTTTGKSATPADKFAGIKAVYDTLLSGLWDKPAGERTVGGGMLLTAMREAYPQQGFTGESLKAWMKEKGVDVVTVRTFKKVAPILARMEQAIAGKADVEKLEKELES